MSAKAISEQTGKEFLYKHICTSAAVQNRFRYARVTMETDWDRLVQDHPWLLTEVGLELGVNPLTLDHPWLLTEVGPAPSALFQGSSQSLSRVLVLTNWVFIN